MINFSINLQDVPNQFWVVTICGQQFINGEPLNPVEQLKAIAQTCTTDELNAFISECEANEEFEKCAILFDELQNRNK